MPVLAQNGAVQIWTPPVAGEQPIRLSSMRIHAKAYGFLASTRIELEFENPNNRVMEGEFVFPLTPAQTVAGYACFGMLPATIGTAALARSN